jgi:hypothetical protein
LDARKDLVEKVFHNKDDNSVRVPVAFQYIIANIQGQLNLNANSTVDITPLEAFELIEQASPFLRSLEGARLQGGPKQNTFGSLFSFEEVTKSEEVDLENPDDDQLRALEEGSLGE